MLHNRTFYKGLARGLAFMALFFALYFLFSKVGHSAPVQPSPVPGRAPSAVTLPNFGPGAGTYGGGSSFVNSITLNNKGLISSVATGTASATLTSSYNQLGTSGNTITTSVAGGPIVLQNNLVGPETNTPGLLLSTGQTTAGGHTYWSPALDMVESLYEGGFGFHAVHGYLSMTDNYGGNSQTGGALTFSMMSPRNNVTYRIFDVGRVDNNRSRFMLWSGNNTQGFFDIDDGATPAGVRVGSYSSVPFSIWAANGQAITIDTAQRVFIGAGVPTTYKFDVNGISLFEDTVTIRPGKFITNLSGSIASIPPTITWIGATMTNSWIAYGAPYEAPAYYKDPMGWVHTRGVVKSGSLNQCVFTYPTGFRPLNTHQFPLVQGAGLGGVDVKNDGCFFVYTVAGGTNASMTVEIPPFYAEQ